MTEDVSRLVNSVAELLQDVTVNLEGLTFYKVAAELRDDIEVDDPEIGDVLPSYSLRLLHEGSEIGVRLAVHLTTDIGEVAIDVAANYVTPVPIDLPSAVHLEFANDVAIMALIPYVRESVWSITQRVFGQALVMPVMQRGEIAFTPDMKSTGAQVDVE